MHWHCCSLAHRLTAHSGRLRLPDKPSVIFNVTGGDQDQVGNFAIDADGTATFDRETGISGPEGADLRATLTQVLPGRSTH